MKKLFLFFALAVGLLTSASTLQAQVNMSRYITLTVKKDSAIRLNFKAATAGTPVRIVSGSNTQNITVGTNWTGNAYYTAGSTTMTVYGDLTDFDCEMNIANLTALDVSHNTQLTYLDCSSNTLSDLDVSQNTQLKYLNCFDNTLTSLDVSGCTQLKKLFCHENTLNSLDVSGCTQLTTLWCYNNTLTSLDVSHNTQLTDLACSSNHLSSLDVSQNTQLTSLGCYNNNLSSLDVSGCTQLEELWCYNNKFTTATLDDIYCALPDRTGHTNGVIQPVFNSSDPNHATVLATNAQNATAKNWKVQYYKNDADIPATTGTYVCGTPHMDIYITLTVTNGAAIKLDLLAAAAGTPVRIVSGSNTQNITVGTSWYGTTSYTAGSTEMKVYGDIIGFDCSGNGANLTALDVSHNTQLRKLYCRDNSLSSLNVSKNTELKGLYCYGNSFSTSALDDIYCALPVRSASDNAEIVPVESTSAPNHATVIATNAQNATAKNWKVLYSNNSADITTTGSYVCPQLNMSSYITLTVTNGAAIKLDFKAASAGTPVRIVSGSNTQNITVGTDWKGTASYTANAPTMTIYGDLTSFDCGGNGANITALDPSHNTQLKRLYCSSNSLSRLDVSKNTELMSLDCYDNTLSSLDVSKNTQLTGLYCSDNNFSTAALDDIYCALPDRTGKESGVIQPVYSDTSSNHATVIATNKANAIAKNWNVQYYKNNSDIPATTGSYVCPQLNMSRYITLTVTNGAAIKLDFEAASAGTPVRIVSGSNTQDIIVGTDWYDGNVPSTFTVTAAASTMTIYGDLTGFACEENGVNLTALDPSHNTQLTELYCGENTLSSLDVSKNTQLTWLYCYNNTLGNLDVSKNTQLDMLDCSNNNLSSLDVSHNTQLTRLDCSSNTLSSLDVSKNTQLQKLICHGNKFSAQALDDIYCALPDRTSETNGVIQPVYSDTSSNHAIVLATNKANAIAKNWNVQYYKNNSDIPATTGKHKCSATDIAEAAAEQALTLYPNPVADVLYLSATARTIRIYNVYGIEVAHATNTDKVEVSHLPAGVYTVRADGSIAKMIKR